MGENEDVRARARGREREREVYQVRFLFLSVERAEKRAVQTYVNFNLPMGKVTRRNCIIVIIRAVYHPRTRLYLPVDQRE